MAVLRLQSQGADVRRLQEILNKIIVAEPPLGVDGIFGHMTKARVVMFQKQTNLTADGIVGFSTNRVLVASVIAATIGRAGRH